MKTGTSRATSKTNRRETAPVRTRARASNRRDNPVTASRLQRTPGRNRDDDGIFETDPNVAAPVGPEMSLILGGAVSLWIGTFALLLGLGPTATAFVAIFCGFLAPVGILAAILR